MRAPSLRLALVLVTLSLWACDGSARRLVLGPEVDVLTETVPAAGATIEIDQPGPLEGLVLEVPSGAYPTETSIEIGYQEITGHSLGQAVPLSPLIRLDNGGEYSEAPMTLTVPIALPADHFAMGFFYDRTTDELEPLPLVELTDTSVTVLTRHFSDVLIAAIVETALEEDPIETPFTLGVDDWQFGNAGTFLHPAGDCAGMSIGAMHYFRRGERNPSQLPLYERYDGVGARRTPGFTWDDADARRFVSIVQTQAFTGTARAEWENELVGARPSLHYYALAFAMALTGQPQYISVRNDTSGHALVAYRIVDATNATGQAVRRIEVYDSNFPYERNFQPHFAEFSVASQDFAAYQQPNGSYPRVLFMARSALIDWPSLETLWQSLENGTIGDGVFPTYSLTWANLDDLTETGTVVPGQPITTEATTLGVRLDASFEGRLTWYDENDALVGSAIGSPPVFGYDLELGSNRVGVRIEGFAGGGPEYIDFVSLDVTRTAVVGPTEVTFPDHSGNYTVTLSFPDGQGTGYRLVPESELGESVYGWGELIDVELDGYPSDPFAWPVASVPVVVSVAGPGPFSWRIYSASNPSDPASRDIQTWWRDTTDPIPMRGDRFYWFYVYPESGPYYQEVLRLRGVAP